MVRCLDLSVEEFDEGAVRWAEGIAILGPDAHRDEVGGARRRESAG